MKPQTYARRLLEITYLAGCQQDHLNANLSAGEATDALVWSRPVADNRPKLVLHRVSGEPFEVRADEIECVQAADTQSANNGARIILSRTGADGCNLQLVVSESADAIARQLASSESARHWQGG